MNRHQCIQSDALACPNALRAPFRPTSRLAPTLYRSALRRSLGAKVFGSGRKGSRSLIRAAAEPEGSILFPATARSLCIPQTDLNAYDGLYQQHFKQTNVTEWYCIVILQSKTQRQRQTTGRFYRMRMLKGSGFPSANQRKYRKVRSLTLYSPVQLHHSQTHARGCTVQGTMIEIVAFGPPYT